MGGNSDSFLEWFRFDDLKLQWPLIEAKWQYINVLIYIYIYMYTCYLVTLLLIPFTIIYEALVYKGKKVLDFARRIQGYLCWINQLESSLKQPMKCYPSHNSRLL